jgi:DDE_Tnp_1-associated
MTALLFPETPMPQPSGTSLLERFATLEDPRQTAKVLYPLPEILLLLLSATLAGADDCVEIELWGEEQLAFLRRLLPYRHGIPSHDTLTGVLAALDPALFKACFVSWVEGLREAEPDLVAIDGKTSRRTHARGKGREPLHLVSAPPRPPGRVPCRDRIDGLLAIDGPPASAWRSARRR